MTRPAPAAKARELADALGTTLGALTVAESYRAQHDPGCASFDYWDRVCAELDKRPGSKSHAADVYVSRLRRRA